MTGCPGVLPNVPTVFALAVELSIARGKTEIVKNPEATIEVIDAHWTLAINPHREPVTVELENMMGGEVPPATVAFWFNGWLAGFVNPHAGTLAAGTLANEELLTRALEKAIAAENGNLS